MTACANRKHTKKVAAVVTASLVGALSLGVAPVAAMATDEGIETQTVESANAFSNGTVTADVYYGTDKVADTTKIEYDSAKAIKVVPVSIEIKGDNVGAIDISDSSVYKVSYYNADKDGKPTDDAILAPSAAGSYVAVIEATSGHYTGGKALFPFKINAKSMAGAVPVTVRPDGSTVAINNTNVVYTASEQEIGFELDGELLTEGVDYTVEYHTAHGDMTDATLIDGVPVKAGDYVAVIKGLGNYAGSEADIQKTVKVNPVNLAACTIENITTDSASLPTMPESIVLQNGVRVTDEALTSQLTLAFDSADNGDIMYKNPSL